MLMSLSERYVFLASGKAASTSFETTFGPDCEIASGNNHRAAIHPVSGGGGKHIKYRTFVDNFDKFFDRFLPIEHFFVFGIVREPMKRLRSLYRYWTRPTKKVTNNLPGITDFPDFVDHVVNRKPIDGRIRVHLQNMFFMDHDRNISLNYLIRMEEMKESIEHLREVSGLDFSRVVTTVRNATKPSSDPVDPGLQRAVERYFAKDYELYEKSSRLLRPWDRSGELDVQAALRWMAKGGNRFEMAGSMLYKLRLRLQADRDFSVAELLASIDGRAPIAAN